MAFFDDSVICEGYLYKTKPIDKLKLLTTWKHKFFVLRRTDSDKAFELSYYKDDSKKGKCKQVNFEEFVAIKPSVSAGRREHCFAIELQKNTYVLQAGDFQVKNLWVAKLCEALRREHVYHVAIPHQAQLSPGHGLLKVLKVEAVVVCPSTTRQLASFKFKSLKRFGSCNDILWFEVCPCTHDNGGLYFFSVGSGSETAEYIINMIKNLIQNLTKQHMVFNNAGSEGPNYSAPQHYSCPGAAPLAQVALVASMRKPSITATTSAPIFKQRKSSTNSMTDMEMMHPRSTTFSAAQRPTPQLVKQPSVTSVDGAARTTLSNFRQASVVSMEGSMPLSRFRQGSMEAPSIPESPRNRSSVKCTERKDSGVFDEEGLTRAVSKTSVSPQGSNSSTEQPGTMDSVPNTASCPYVNYSSAPLPVSPNDTDSPPISPLQQQNSLSPVQEHPTQTEDQGPPVAPPRSLISLMGPPPPQ